MFSVTSIVRITAKDLYQHIVSIISISLMVSLLCVPFLLFLPWQLAIGFALFIGGPVWLAATASMETVLTNKTFRLYERFSYPLNVIILKG